MNVLILLGIVSLFIFGRKVSSNWITGIKDTLNKMMDFSTDRRLFSSWTANPIGWTRNTQCWARAYNWSGTAAGIMGLGGVGGGSLISRRHVLLADHVPYPARPFEIFFVNRPGKTFTYKVTKIDSVPGTDIAIGTLDQDADPSLVIYRVLPNDWARYVQGFTLGTAMGLEVVTLRLPVLYLNQEKMVSTGDIVRLVSGTAQVEPPAFAPAQAYYQVQRGGDSGNPIFVQVGDELVLLGAWHQVGVFPWILTHKGAIEAIIGQKLLVADLSGFTRVA